MTEPNLQLPVSAKIFGFLRKCVVFCTLQMIEFAGEGVNLRKSAVFRENLRFGLSLSLSPEFCPFAFVNVYCKIVHMYFSAVGGTGSVTDNSKSYTKASPLELHLPS